MISKRHNTLRKNQRKRSKKNKMITDGINPIRGNDGVCYKDKSEHLELLTTYSTVTQKGSKFLTENMQKARCDLLKEFKKNLDIAAPINGNDYHPYTPELFNTYVTTPINNHETFKTYCYIGLEPSIQLTTNFNSGIQPNLHEYTNAGFTIPDLLRCGVMFSTMNYDSRNQIKEFMTTPTNKDTLITIIQNLQQNHGFTLDTFKKMEFTASILKAAGFSSTDLKDELVNIGFKRKDILNNVLKKLKVLYDVEKCKESLKKYQKKIYIQRYVDKRV